MRLRLGDKGHRRRKLQRIQALLILSFLPVCRCLERLESTAPSLVTSILAVVRLQWRTTFVKSRVDWDLLLSRRSKRIRGCSLGLVVVVVVPALNMVRHP